MTPHATAFPAGADADAMASPSSPDSFQGDTVPDTPVAEAMLVQAGMAGDMAGDRVAAVLGQRAAEEAAVADADTVHLVFDQDAVEQNSVAQVITKA